MIISNPNLGKPKCVWRINTNVSCAFDLNIMTPTHHVFFCPFSWLLLNPKPLPQSSIQDIWGKEGPHFSSKDSTATTDTTLWLRRLYSLPWVLQLLLTAIPSKAVEVMFSKCNGHAHVHTCNFVSCILSGNQYCYRYLLLDTVTKDQSILKSYFIGWISNNSNDDRQIILV